MHAITDILHLMTTSGLWFLTLQVGALLLLPALGGTISERSGVTNIAMEGMMLTGAFAAIVADVAWGNPWLATLVAVVCGGLMALIHAVVSIRFRADQIIAGFGINIFAFGLTFYLFDKLYQGENASKDHINQSQFLPTIHVPLLNKIPFFGHILFDQNVMVYIALLLLVGMQFMLFRTKLGLRIRAVGEHPQAADTAGINVYALRYFAVIMSGLLSGLGGAFLSIGVVGTFNPGMTSGRGYIALAAMIFGKWTPIGSFIACLIFGIGYALFANNSTIHASAFVLNMLPYILTLVVLAGLVGRSVAPAADGIPYEPGVE